MITIHLPKTPETQGLIGKDAARQDQAGRDHRQRRPRRPDRRGRAGRRRARGPRRRRRHRRLRHRADHRRARCSSCPNVAVTPHLGASTAEAQDRAGTDVARSVLLALRGDFVPDAVNVAAGGAVGEEVRPWLGSPRSSAACSPRSSAARRSSVTVQVRGELAHEDVSVLRSRRCAGCSREVVDEPGHLRQRAGAGRGARRPRRPCATAAGEPQPPQHGHAARGMPGRRRRHRVGHAHRRATRSRSSSRSTAALRPARRGPRAALRVLRPPGRMGRRRHAARRVGDQHRGRADLPDARRRGAIMLLRVDRAVDPRGPRAHRRSRSARGRRG